MLAVASLAAVLLLGGCGGSSGRGGAEKQVTVPAYSHYPAMTIPVSAGTRAQCRREAEAFSRAAVAYLAPFPSDADNFMVIARVQFYAFRAHLCDVSILHDALARRTTARQRRVIVDGFAFLGDTGRALTPP
jgi:hypothetical protein